MNNNFCELHGICRPCDILESTALFKGLKRDSFRQYCQTIQQHAYVKGEMIVAQTQPCQALGVIEYGRIAIQKYLISGDYSTMGLLGPKDFFGEDLIFGQYNDYSFTLEAVVPTRVIYIGRETLLHMMKCNELITGNFLQILSDRIDQLHRRISLLSQKTLRQKIAYYLLELAQLSADADNLPETIELPVSKEVVAKLLVMPRPSLSRELIAMENDGWIKIDGRQITLCDPQALASNIIEDYVLPGQMNALP